MNIESIRKILPEVPNGAPPPGIFCAVGTMGGGVGIGVRRGPEDVDVLTSSGLAPWDVRGITRHAPLPDVGPLLEYLQASCPPDEFGIEPEHEAETVVDRAIRVLRHRRAAYQDVRRNIRRLGETLRKIRTACNAILDQSPTVSALDESEKAPEPVNTRTRLAEREAWVGSPIPRGDDDAP